MDIFLGSHEIDEIFDAQLAQYARLLVEVYPSGKIDSDHTVNTLGTVGHKYESKYPIRYLIRIIK